MWPRNRGRGRHNNRGGGQWNFPPGNRGHGNFNRGFRRGGPVFRDNFNSPKGTSYRNDNTFYKKQYRNKVVEKLSEIDIGITEFIGDLIGFTGVIKSRYSDFHVNEIDLDGNVAKLTCLDVPKDPEPEREEEDDDLLVNRYRIEQLPIETWDKIHTMIQKNDKTEIVEIDVTSMTKEDRTKIHEAVKTVFGSKIVGSTINKGDKKFVTIKLYNKYEKVDRREKWPKSRGGEYVYFLLYKEYTDTIEASIQISECLHMRPSHFCYAGVKDRRAKTTQWFCTRKIEPSRIAYCTKSLRNIKVGNFCYKNETLKLGQLKGNRFRIALRNVTANNEIIEKAMEFLRENGFINYYGLQRFGNCKEIPTHKIGIKLLNGNWKEAVQLILRPRKYEQDRMIGQAKEIYERTGNAAKAHAILEKKRNRCIEGRLLGGLANAEKDYVNALENVPRNMRLLYIHAFQSYVWNIIVSRRIKEFGLKPIIGDIVLDGESAENLESVEGIDEEKLETSEDSETTENNESKEVINKKTVKVKILTENDLENYTIYDIVLPLPGFDITYPNNETKNWYEEILKENDLTLEMPKQKVKTYTLSGTYRKIVEKVTNFSWKIMHYNDFAANLIRSDYEELQGIPEPTDIPNGKFKSIIIDLCLPSCCYATMALRQVMKMDTSVETQMNYDLKMNPEKLQKSENSSNSTNESAINNEEELNDSVKNVPEKRKIDEEDVVEDVDSKKLKTENNGLPSNE